MKAPKKNTAPAPPPAPQFTKYWMVHCAETGPARYCHPSKAAAMDEAKRLAAAAPGKLFAVLEAVAGAIAPIEVLEARAVKSLPALPGDDGIPF